jgi:membrane fusion protein, multidrug efflux system
MPRPGKLLFSDLTVDTTTGQVTLRAEVPNPGGAAAGPVRARAAGAGHGQQRHALPQQAVTRTAQGDTVMVVDADGKVSPAPVKVGGQQGASWVVLEGLKAGEQVMVDGFQKLRCPATPVKPVPWTPGRRACAPRRQRPGGQRNKERPAWPSSSSTAPSSRG